MIVEEKRNLSNNINSSTPWILQNLIFENSEKINVIGVNDVLSFDNKVVIV